MIPIQTRKYGILCGWSWPERDGQRSDAVLRTLIHRRCRHQELELQIPHRDSAGKNDKVSAMGYLTNVVLDATLYEMRTFTHTHKHAPFRKK